MRILLVEDDEHVADALAAALRQYGYDIAQAPTAAKALAAMDAPELILLDLGLPDLDGIELCRRMRSGSDVPIIVLTARTDEIDKVLGLNAGADDYIIKPYSLHELRARIEAVARRSCRCGMSTQSHDACCSADARSVVTADRLTVDLRTREVTLDDSPVQLTRKEFELLAMLVADPETVHTREAIIAQVWDENWYGSTRTLDVHIGALRQKLGSYDWIETSRGVGFRLGHPPAA
jgi:DNA-binding response OmpR family regulator